MTISSEWGTDVSRETSEKLLRYEELLVKWNPAINLVSKSSIKELRTRHIIDSVQLFSLLPKQAKKWVDMGSGGGFPGLVCAILAQEKSPDTMFELIESDSRKAEFLRTVARETGIVVNVHNARIENVGPLRADVISARALSSLDNLLGFADLHMEKSGIALFPKGARYRQELEAASKNWTFNHQQFSSITDNNAVLLQIEGIVRV